MGIFKKKKTKKQKSVTSFFTKKIKILYPGFMKVSPAQFLFS